MLRNRLQAALVCAAFLFISCSREPKPEQAQLYKVGDKVQAGHLYYTVVDSRWVTQLPGSPTPRLPQNRFFLVHVKAMNGSGDNTMLPNLTIEDESGKSYPELNDGTGVPDWAGYLRKVIPAEVSQGNIVFDAPPKSYKLRVTDENGENPALIDIPLSFGADTGGASTPLAPKTP